jgi:hypothetical protein
MVNTLTRQRCWVHLEREAAARCPVCTHFYCRECVTEHEGRVICAPCLRTLLAASAARRTRIGAGSRRVLATGVRGLQLVFGIGLAWCFFFLLGEWLLTTTSKFHEGELWKEQLFGGGDPDSSGGGDEDSDKKADKSGKTDNADPGGKADED